MILTLVSESDCFGGPFPHGKREIEQKVWKVLNASVQYFIRFLMLCFLFPPGNRFREQQRAFVVWREVLDAEDLRLPSMPPTMKKNSKRDD